MIRSISTDYCKRQDVLLNANVKEFQLLRKFLLFSYVAYLDQQTDQLANYDYQNIHGRCNQPQALYGKNRRPVIKAIFVENLSR